MPAYELPLDAAEGVVKVPVEFPFAAYDCQLQFMSTVVKALQNSENALLESPTGTGKTLSLLCACIAFIRHYNNTMHQQTFDDGDPSLFMNNNHEESSSARPRIIYASRTHSQLSQVVHELRRTAYRDTKICVMGSREQMCINDKVNKLSSNAARTHLCRQLVSQKSCYYHLNMHSVMGRYNYAGNDLKDIEELVQYGQEQQACPYYMARDSQASADIIFLPYNYIVDPASRKSQNIQLENAILIFDEAHNLESSCGEACSFELTPTDIAMCLDEVQRCTALQDDMDYRDRVVVDELNILKSTNSHCTVSRNNITQIVLLHSFREKLDELQLCDTKDLTLSGEFIFSFFESVGITFKNVESLLKICDSVVSLLSQEAGRAGRSFKPSLTQWQEALRVVFHPSNRQDRQSFARNYKIYVHMETGSGGGGGSSGKSLWSSAPKSVAGRILSFWCFSSGVTMRQLVQEKCRSIVLASGTLSPLDSFAAELQIPFPHRLENPHVIDKSQILVNVVCKGPQNVALNSSYQNRNSSSYQMDLGQSIVEFCRIVPDGLLVFFPSYGYMATCVEQWKRSGLWSKIAVLKTPYVEPKDKQTFSTTISTFYDSISGGGSDSGAIFFAVCRGKASEGIDFSDTRGRAVILTGIPFSSVADPRVKLKKQFLDENYRQEMQSGVYNAANKNRGISLIDGQTWYKQQAARAVNQALGRVIRHRHDWGAVLLCDERFSQPSSISGLPLWLRGYVQVQKSFSATADGLRRFVGERTRLTKELEAAVKATTPPSPVNLSKPFAVITANGGSANGNFGESSTMTVPAKRGLQLKQPALLHPQDLRHPSTGLHHAAANQQQRFAIASSSATLNRPISTGDSGSCGGGGGGNSLSLLGTVSSIISRNQMHSSSEFQRRPLISTDGQQFSRLIERHNLNQQQHQQHQHHQHQQYQQRQSTRLEITAAAVSPETHSHTLSSVGTKELPVKNVKQFLDTLKSVLSKPDYKQFQSLLKSFKTKELKIDRFTEEIILLFSRCNQLGLCLDLLPFLPSKHHQSFRESVEQRSSNSSSINDDKDWFTAPVYPSKEQNNRNISNSVESPVVTEEEKSKQLGAAASQCPMCKQKIIKPFQSRCKHVGCYECWIIWLESRKACPVCDKPTRIRQLSKIFFSPKLN